MTLTLIAAGALLVGVTIGTRCTRRAVRTTTGRQRHGIPVSDSRQIITGEVAGWHVDPSTMEQALTTATEHLHTRSLYAGPAPVHPPTVAIPRIDGTLPTRPPAPPTPAPRRKPAEWSTRA